MQIVRVVVAALVVTGCPARPAPDSELRSASSARNNARASASLEAPEQRPIAADDACPNPIECFSERRAERERMVDRSVAPSVRDPRVIAAVRRVPRHRFVPEGFREHAYDDRPLPIGFGQTISQPSLVAEMTEAVEPRPADRCLEIGTGSGYQAAILAELCDRVYSIEYLPELAAFAQRNLRSLGYTAERVALRTGDGYRGWPDAAPFDVVIVTAAPEHVPAPLLDQLALRGRLLIPVGPSGGVQRLELWTRRRPGSDRGAFVRRVLSAVQFVPFVGEAQRK